MDDSQAISRVIRSTAERMYLFVIYIRDLDVVPPSSQTQYNVLMSFCSVSLTLQRVSGQPQLTDDVPRDVCLHQLSLLGVVLRCLQQMVKLFWVELLSFGERMCEVSKAQQNHHTHKSVTSPQE